MNHTNTRIFAAACFALTCAAAPAHAADYPERTATIVVPYPAGGTSDTISRAVAQHLSTKWGQKFIVENKPGANSAIGAAAVARAAPDGYTILSGSIGTFSTNPGLYPNLQYDPAKDFAYLTLAVRTPNVLVGAPDLAPNNLVELLDYAKENPGKLSFANGGAGSSDHISAVLFRQLADIEGIDVPYKGGSLAQADLMASQVNLSFQNLGNVTQYIKAGRMKAYAVTSEQRVPQLPDVPTLREAGLTDMVIYSWQGFAVPKATPSDVVQKLSAGMREALTESQLKARLEGMGFDVPASSPEQFAAFQHAEETRWTAFIKKHSMQAN